MPPLPAAGEGRGEGDGRSLQRDRRPPVTDPAPRLGREVIAMRVAREFGDGEVVNLGIGIPTLCSDFVPPGVQLIYQSESGLLNCGPLAGEDDGQVDLINAGGQFLSPIPGMAFFDSAEAFALIRGGAVAEWGRRETWRAGVGARAAGGASGVRWTVRWARSA